jgi:outer membrane receptor for ferrienterochelin and colicin
LNILRRAIHALVAIAFFAGATVLPASQAAAQATTTTISGVVVSQDTGLGIAGASVTLYQGTTVVTTATTDGNGAYTFAQEPAGFYTIGVAANGFGATRVNDVVAAAGTSATIRTPLLRATTDSSSYREIGRTTSGVQGSTLAASSTIQHNLDPNQLLMQGFLKSADAIAQLPGVNLTGGPHTIGDDTTIDIRGMGAGEVRPLLDGHPMGPIGVLGTDYYNYANSPFSLLDNIQVTVGSGASGLYGVDVIGGTIDFQTLSPTAKPHGQITQQVGNDGTLGTILTATGTVGRLGYAIGHSVVGTYGDFASQQIFQGARPNNNANLPNGGACTASNDITSCNTALNTYAVSANYKELNDLAKLRYNFTPTTALTISAYAGNDHADSTGNGDNDNIPYATRLAQIQTKPQTCPGGYTVATNANPAACLTATQWAAASFGPDGGGADRNRGTSLQDFNARFTTQLGMHSVSIDTFSDYYNYHKYSSTAAGYDPTGTFFVGTGTYTDNYLTHGFLVTDDIASSNNDFGYGYYVEHQADSGNNFAYDSTANAGTLVPQPELGEGDYSFFLRDNYTPSEKFAIYLNAWDRRSSVTNHTSLDPRISVVFKPTHRDIVRLTAGQADGDPAASVAFANALSGFNNPFSLNPTCAPGLLNSVATGGSSNLLPERSSDVEGAYGHTFWADTSINVVAYASSVKDQLFSGVFPITASALANPTISGALGGFATKINATCGTTYTASTVQSVLGLSGVFNASSALFRGVEITGRVRVTPQVRLDYVYDIQSSQQFGEPVEVLVNNPYVLDGGQIVGIPVHKGSLAADYSQHGFEAQLQGYYIGVNNTLNRPAYTFFNGFLSQSIGKHLTVTLSGFNLFDQNSQIYGYFGEQLPNPENQYQTGLQDPVSQAVNVGFGSTTELLGLEPRLITLSVMLKI